MISNLDLLNTSIFSDDNLAGKLYSKAGSIASDIYSDSLSIWDREDSAYQRMVEDMKKAGLNPWTGISSGGLSTGHVNPSMDSLTGLIQVLGGWLNAREVGNHTLRDSSQASKNVMDAFNKVVNMVSNFFG